VFSPGKRPHENLVFKAIIELFIFNCPLTGGENVSYYLLYFIRIINGLINEVILNQYVPIVKIINFTILTSAEMYGKNTNAA
jgi:hypothetical protein